MRDSISNTAEYGDYTVGPKLITDKTKKAMKKQLEKIQKGAFAREFIKECKAGKPNMEKMRSTAKNELIERVGGELRKMMSWIKN